MDQIPKPRFVLILMAAAIASSPGICGDLREQIIQRIVAAQKSIDVVVYEIRSDEMADALLSARDRGLRVRVIVDSVHSAMATAQEKRMEEGGVPVKRVSGTSRKLLHDKFILFDRKLASTPSYNRSARSLREARDEESSFTEEANLIKKLASEFDEFWASTAQDEVPASVSPLQ
jgi:phosphatidylserine/phosphatidylglycerophosphate/cardiolipin synthase-like enzyme